ncbi:fumarylacetoacetate hydrolase family protein [Sphingomonas sp. PAMC 26617]|uniref:fumarylacetoacetate hydrolase family protein n=1 Tax=Sphingomonas sp. PAMC 26617 TaxID=1112216 RepID=UPI0002887C83|nr:fumarylacetoacetate hydrolase family protein [Sphingomonas sp. PAMC 26617]
MTQFSLATVSTQTGPAAALIVANRCFLLAQLDPALAGVDALAVLRSWDSMLPRLKTLADAAPASSAIADPHMLAPILYPDTLLAVGANYSGHLKEMGLKVEKWAVMPFFIRPPRTTLVGPGETVRIPRSTKQFDWECELAIVVGAPLRHASKEEAAAAIAGYTIGLDLSCRDLIPVDNELHVDLLRGKAQDTMAPCGPAIVPAEFIDNVDDLRIQLSVNGETMMDARTSEMLYKCDEMLATISEYITLAPGDICFTGSPSGSAGVHGDRWLKPGDHIRAEIEQVGVLEVTMRSDG